MKKAILLLCVLFLSNHLFAQQGISFQGIARDAQGNAITTGKISVTFTIGSFTETQEITPDKFGVFSAIIGSMNQIGFNNLVFANTNENLKVEVDGTVIYNDKFNTVPYSKAAENGVSPGCIMPYAGSVTSGGALIEPIPGWLVCNGATIPTDSKYNKLKQVIGDNWGANKLPDLRGVFLRGVNNGRTGTYADPDTRTVGTFQKDTLKSHDHSGKTSEAGQHWHQVKNGTANTAASPNNFPHGGWSPDPVPNLRHNTDTIPNHTHTIPIYGGLETRPKNAAVVYIIKY